MLVVALSVLAGAWLALLVAAPLLPSAASALVYAAASLVCHQLPERSFHLDAIQFPVCARCLGIYAGAGAGCVAALVAGPASVPASHARAARMWRLGATGIALLPTAITVALEWMGLWYPSNLTRAAAGVAAGLVVALVVARAAATVHYGEWASRPPTVPSRPPSSI